MGKERKIIASHRCFFPKGAFFKSTDRVAELAKEVGYEGIEFLPTWRFVYEMRRYGKLLAPEEVIASGHRDWRIDRVMLARLDNKPDWAYQLKEKADLLFPPTNICLVSLKEFQKVYQKPVSTTWFGDTKNFSPVMLELHGYKVGVDEKKLFEWLKEDPQKRGIVVDITKFPKWLESIGKLDRKDEILKKLVPYIFEIHYRQIRKDNQWKLMTPKEGKEIIRQLSGYGYQGKVVVEFGWPDLDKPPFGLLSEDLEEFKELHQKTINFIRNI
jgi:hypothetical protein